MRFAIDAKGNLKIEMGEREWRIKSKILIKPINPNNNNKNNNNNNNHKKKNLKYQQIWKRYIVHPYVNLYKH